MVTFGATPPLYIFPRISRLSELTRHSQHKTTQPTIQLWYRHEVNQRETDSAWGTTPVKIHVDLNRHWKDIVLIRGLKRPELARETWQIRSIWSSPSERQFCYVFCFAPHMWAIELQSRHTISPSTRFGLDEAREYQRRGWRHHVHPWSWREVAGGVLRCCLNMEILYLSAVLEDRAFCASVGYTPSAELPCNTCLAGCRHIPPAIVSPPST